MVAFTTLVCSVRLERISTPPFGTRVYTASLSHLCRVTLLWPFKHHGASVTVLAATPPPPPLPRRHHLKPAFGGTPPLLSLGAPAPAILYRLEIAKHLSAMAILLQLLSHRHPDRFGYLA